MSYIYVDQISFEHALTASFADLPTNQGTGTQSIGEQVVSVAHIYVDILNLEVPLAVTPFDTLVNVGSGTQTILEEISGTPVAEPEVAVGGGVSSRIRVMGGRPWSEEDIYVLNHNEATVSEEIGVHEYVENLSVNLQSFEATIRKPVYKRQRDMEIRNFMLAKDKSIIIPNELNLTRRQKDEEELLLLGII